MAETEEQPGWRRPSRSLVALLVILSLLLAFVVWALHWWGGPSEAPVTPIADVSSERLLSGGGVVGFAAAHETHAWLGIPYARAPVGALRWRAPQAAAAWVDTLDALAFGPSCPQLSPAPAPVSVGAQEEEGHTGDEDCLSLNVWAPRREPEVVTAADPMPVIVWLHGGGNRRGTASSSRFDGARLAGSQGVVVVSLNYRLGPLGWLAHPALRSEAGDPFEASGNFGLLDQIEALRWIRDNIAEFGGDPRNVTIMGASAGATDVFALSLAPPARGLFHRVIAQSGSTDAVSRAAAENALDATPPGERHASAEIVVRLLERAGVVPDREAARGYAADLAPEDLLAFLRGLPAEEILDAYRSPENPAELDVPTLIRDGALLPTGDWLEEIRAGRFARVPVLLGSNRDEMKRFLSQDPDHVQEGLGVFYRIRDREDYLRRARLHSDLWAVRAVTEPARALSETNFSPVFADRFDWAALPRIFGQDMSALLGAAHGFELPFVFGTFDLGDPLKNRLLFTEETQAERERLAERMMAYWATFAREGRPGRGGREDLPEWLPWASGDGGGTTLLLDSEADGGVRLATTQVTREQVIASVDAEPGLDQAEKCALLFDLFHRDPDWSLDMVPSLGARGCAEHPPSIGRVLR